MELSIKELGNIYNLLESCVGMPTEKTLVLEDEIFPETNLILTNGKYHTFYRRQGKGKIFDGLKFYMNKDIPSPDLGKRKNFYKCARYNVLDDKKTIILVENMWDLKIIKLPDEYAFAFEAYDKNNIYCTKRGHNFLWVYDIKGNSWEMVCPIKEKIAYPYLNGFISDTNVRYNLNKHSWGYELEKDGILNVFSNSGQIVNVFGPLYAIFARGEMRLFLAYQNDMENFMYINSEISFNSYATFNVVMLGRHIYLIQKNGRYYIFNISTDKNKLQYFDNVIDKL